MDFNLGGKSPEDIFKIILAGGLMGIITIKWIAQIVLVGHPLIDGFDFFFLTTSFLLISAIER